MVIIPIMTTPFIPNKFRRNNLQYERNNTPLPAKPPTTTPFYILRPAPQLWYNPRPEELNWSFTIDLAENIDPDKIDALYLEHFHGAKIFYGFNTKGYLVLLTEPRKWSEICEVTRKVVDQLVS